MIFKISNFLIGTCLASHACVIVERAGKEDFIFSRSKCTNCNQQLNIFDEIPLISYLLLKGRCRYCKIQIPAEYFVTEFLGGFTFLKIDFSNPHDAITAIVLFNILLAAISDYQSKEFDIVFVAPAFFISALRIIKTFEQINITDLVEFCPIFLLFLYETIKHKIGKGDLLIYLILTFCFDPKFTNLTFLTASIILLSFFIVSEVSKKEPVAFIPFIYIGLIIQLLSN
ncbi:A24 family peptidase [uncultured Lactobacillus sp.]|uniref:prepilin peptidase n=1 Tax=uncultured Lactobacillus sp. TaxID=153152 RepID=UPI0025CE6A1E|nr:A24 family peptidase [uncultured Lactobacillus sp.]